MTIKIIVCHETHFTMWCVSPVDHDGIDELQANSGRFQTMWIESEHCLRPPVCIGLCRTCILRQCTVLWQWLAVSSALWGWSLPFRLHFLSSGKFFICILKNICLTCLHLFLFFVHPISRWHVSRNKWVKSSSKSPNSSCRPVLSSSVLRRRTTTTRYNGHRIWPRRWKPSWPSSMPRVTRRLPTRTLSRIWTDFLHSKKHFRQNKHCMLERQFVCSAHYLFM